MKIWKFENLCKLKLKLIFCQIYLFDNQHYFTKKKPMFFNFFIIGYVEIMIYTAVSQPSCFSWFDLKNLIYQETASSLEPKHNSYIPLFNFDAYFMLEELHLKCSWPISRDWSGHIWHSLPSLEYSHSDLCLMISFRK